MQRADHPHVSVPMIRNEELGVAEAQLARDKKQKRKKRGQCCLTAEGAALLSREIENLDPEYQTDSGLAVWVGDGFDRETVEKIRNRSKAVRYASIARLFSKLELTLEDEHWDEWCRPLDDSRSGQNKSTDLKRVTQGNRSPGSPEWQANVVLRWLDYREQRDRFQSICDAMKPCGTFLIRTQRYQLDRWLVWRLATELPGFAGARVAAPDLASSVFWKDSGNGVEFDLAAFWSNLASELFQCDVPQSGLAEKLKTAVLTQSIILVLRNVHVLTKQEDYAEIIKFWTQVVTITQCSARRICATRFALFLTDDRTNPQLQFGESLEFNPDHPEVPVDLGEFIAITSEDLDLWVPQLVRENEKRKDEPYVQLIDLLEGADKVEPFIEQLQRQNELNSDPIKLLGKICFRFRFGESIAALERGWKLTA